MFVDSGFETSDYFSWGDLGSPTITQAPTLARAASYDAGPRFTTMNLNSSSTKQPRTLAPNLTRRSHKKSRAGCYTCKGRKIKCGEQKPKCTNCLTKGLDCIYPAVNDLLSTTPSSAKQRSHKHDAAGKDGASGTATSLSKKAFSSPTGGPSSSTFSILDMKFFHHFLTSAYPHLPLGNDHVWVNEIPQFAEAHPYLMHAILSLGASHLSRLTGVDYRKESLTHRGLAISGLNQALSQSSTNTSTSTASRSPPHTSSLSPSSTHAPAHGESDAMLATCYSLTFQASYMGGSDGLADFITMVRGCALTTAKIKQDDVPTAFNLQPNWHFKVMAPRLAQLPRVDSRLVEDGIKELEKVLKEVMALPDESGEGGEYRTMRGRNSSREDIENWEDSEVEANFCQSLIEVLEALMVSPQGGYLQFAGLYAVWYELPPELFAHFLSPSNLPSQLLLSYFVSLQMLMVPLAVYEWPERAESAKSRVLTGTVEWAEGIFDRLVEDDRQRMRQSASRRQKSVAARRQNLGTEEDVDHSSDDDWSWERYLKWPRRIMGIVSREIRGDLRLNEVSGRSDSMPRTNLDLGLAVKAEDVGVNVLKLGVSISPSTTTDGGDGDSLSTSGGYLDAQGQANGVPLMPTVSLPDDDTGVGADVGMFDGYWDAVGGVPYGDIGVDPGLMTSLGIDATTAASDAVAMVRSSMMQDINLDVDML